MLFTIRSMRPELVWKEKLLKFSFWSINFGLLAMMLLSLLPVGLMQTWASVETGYWYARSPEFLQLPILTTLRWMRVFGDTIFSVGTVTLILFIFGLSTGHSLQKGKAQRD